MRFCWLLELVWAVELFSMERCLRAHMQAVPNSDTQSLICGGEPCTCGRKGCDGGHMYQRQRWSAMQKEPCSNTRIHPEYNVSGEIFRTWMEKFRLMPHRMGIQQQKKVVNDYICYLGELITNFVNIFRPDVVLLSGGICNQGKNWQSLLKHTFRRINALVAARRLFRKLCAVLGNKAGIIGAAKSDRR